MPVSRPRRCDFADLGARRCCARTTFEADVRPGGASPALTKRNASGVSPRGLVSGCGCGLALGLVVEFEDQDLAVGVEFASGGGFGGLERVVGRVVLDFGDEAG